MRRNAINKKYNSLFLRAIFLGKSFYRGGINER